MNDNSWRPCEKTHSTAVDVATKNRGTISNMIGNEHVRKDTWDAKIIQCHPMKVWVNMTVRNPPLERLLDVLNWFAKILLDLASPRSDMPSYRDICKGSKVVIVIVNLQDTN